MNPIINFKICGRLGNAIFRYFACVIMCILFNGVYTIDNNLNLYNFGDIKFSELSNLIFNNVNIQEIVPNINMIGFYQHDKIYKLFKNKILDFIKINPNHYVLTDGVNAGDGNYEKLFIKDIINTPEN